MAIYDDICLEIAISMGFLKQGYPQIIHFQMGFSTINHPFRGTPVLEAPMVVKTYVYIYIYTYVYTYIYIYIYGDIWLYLVMPTFCIWLYAVVHMLVCDCDIVMSYTML